MEDIVLLYTTLSSQEEALKVANNAINDGLAGCVNIIPGIISVYNWQGKNCQDQEWGCLFKTTQEKFPKLKTWLEEHHPYDLPAIVKIKAETTQEFFNFLR